MAARTIRPEAPGDAAAIRAVTAAAFAGMAHSDGTEPAIVDGLRAAGALTVSLVAVADGTIIGHAAFSSVTIDQAGDHGGRGWLGLGPVSVAPGWQRRGTGSALVRAGLALCQESSAGGCVVLGEPAFYGRFGFRADPRLRLEGVPPAYFQMLAFGGDVPSGMVRFHPAFGVK
ncbi:MAG: N-acetyltransferase [Alphaproteobacteria bacterium]